jgi:large subunit ribosomal protein L32
MPVPKHRTSASKRNMRRSHHALKAPGMSICPDCQEVKKPHAVCGSCGHYKGKHVLDVAGHDHDHDHGHDHAHEHGHDSEK